MTPVIFLDVDGVLNCQSTFLENNYNMTSLCDQRLSLFADIIKQTSAIVVMSSSWRIDQNTREYIESHLLKKGVKVHDVTPFLNCTRHIEIVQWINDNKHMNFGNIAIIDDDTDACIPANLHMEVKDLSIKYFQTHFDTGLTEKDALAIIDWLNNGNSR